MKTKPDPDRPGTAAGQNPAAATTEPPSGRGETIAKVGTVISAIVASSCCWLPLLLLAVGISGAGIASALEEYRPLFIVVTFGFLAAAFYFTYRPRRASPGGDCCAADCCASEAPAQNGGDPPAGKRRFNMMALNKLMLWGVTAFAVLFLFFPQSIGKLLGPGGGDFTADMLRTELIVQGMTCAG